MAIKTYTLRELEDLTVEWSTNNGIIINSNAGTQANKLTSEFGELCGHLHDNKLKKCKDDIGDMLVVLTNLSRLVGAKSLEECMPNFNDKREGILMLGCYLGDLCDNIIKNELEEAKTNIGNCIYQLIVLADRVCKTSIDICWAIAYNEIKDRKGFLTPDGTFIKDTDPAYKDWVKDIDTCKCIKADLEYRSMPERFNELEVHVVAEFDSGEVEEYYFFTLIEREFLLSNDLLGLNKQQVKNHLVGAWAGKLK